MSAAAAEGTALTYQGQEYIVGDRMTGEQLDALPVGSKVQEPTGHIFTKKNMSPHNVNPWSWAREDRRCSNLRSMVNRLVSIGVSVPDVLPTDLAGFKAAFSCAVTELTAQYTEAHQAVAERILRDLDGAHPADPPKPGTVATFGRPDQRGFTVFRWGAHGWVKLVGALDSAEGLVLSYDGGGGDVGAYKAAAWEAGQRAKQDEKWCSAYDNLLARFGITDPGPHPDFTPWPDLVKGEEGRAELPDGAVLGVDRGDWGIFWKTHGEWERICGTRPLAAGTMHLLFNGEGDLRIENANALLEFLPAGTEIQTHRGYTYSKVDDARWSREGIRYDADFRLPVTVTRLP